MKLFMLLLVLVLGSAHVSFATDGYTGGDMPFPIGKVIDLPVQELDGDLWKVPQIKRFLKIDFLETPTPDGDLKVQLLAYKQLAVLAEGVGHIKSDKTLRAILKYKKYSRYVAVTVGSYCDDEKPRNGYATFTLETCLLPKYMVGFEQVSGSQKNRLRAYGMRKFREGEE